MDLPLLVYVQYVKKKEKKSETFDHVSLSSS